MMTTAVKKESMISEHCRITDHPGTHHRPNKTVLR